MKRSEIKKKIKELKEECLTLEHSRLKKDRERRHELPTLKVKYQYFSELLKHINNIEYEINKEML
jgi:hypothetical protein